MGFTAGTRITLFLPCNNSEEMKIINKIINRLRTKYRGISCSLSMPPGFKGYYKKILPNGKRVWTRDDIVFLVVDSQEKIDDTSLEKYLRDLKADIFKYFESGGSPQDEIWIIAHPIWRLA